jgi:hypothetical protein
MRSHALLLVTSNSITFYYVQFVTSKFLTVGKISSFLH